MGKRREPICYGGLEFRTYQEAREHYQRVKSAAPKRTWLTDPFLLDVYNRNPHMTFEITAVKFVPHEIDRFGDWGVIARGADGELYDRPISNKYAFGTQSTAARNHKRLRLLIQPDADEYRAAMREAEEPCHHCSTRPGSEADHVVTFASIVSDWLREFRLTHEDLVWEPANDRRWFRLIPPEIESSWLVYHTERCEWQWLCAACHKQKTASEA